VAVADTGVGEPRWLGTIPNDHDALRSLLRKIGPPSRLRVCYEAGPCGYVRFLQRLKVDCTIVTPSLIPRKAGDRIKWKRHDLIDPAGTIYPDPSGRLKGPLPKLALTHCHFQEGDPGGFD